MSGWSLTYDRQRRFAGTLRLLATVRELCRFDDFGTVLRPLAAP